MTKCSFCQNNLSYKVLDLGLSPLANGYLDNKKKIKYEKSYPLELYICDKCKLVQTSKKLPSKIVFQKDYSYLSSTSKTWVEHSEKYFHKIKKKLKLNKNSFVLEIASNDGYLLDFFNKAKIPNLGIEPTLFTSNVAKKKGIKVVNDFFSLSLAKKLSRKLNKIDLIIANNVIAHIPDLNNFVKGLSLLMNKYQSVATLEFQYLKTLIEKNQFDTVYHEHYFYYSLLSINNVLTHHNLKIIDVEKLKTHGGSLRLYVASSNKKVGSEFNIKNFVNVQKNEKINKIDTLNYYKKFQFKTNESKKKFIKFLNVNKNKKIFAYGAAAKGNTFLNFVKTNSNFIENIFDQSKLKIGKYLPGTHIPILDPANIKDFDFDILLIMPWNIKDEIIKKYKNQIPKKAKFVSIAKFLSYN